MQNLLRCQRSSLWRGNWAVTTSAPAVPTMVAIVSRFSPVVGVRRHRGRQGRESVALAFVHDCGGHPAEHPAAPRGPRLVQKTSCFQSGPAWSWSGPGLHPWSGPGPVRSWSDPGPVLVRYWSWSGPGPVSSGREDGSVRVCVRRWPGAVAQPYRSTGAPPKRLAAQSLRRSPKRRVGGPNATTTVLGPRSQGGIAPGVAIVRRNRRQRRGRRAAFTTIPRPGNRLRGGKTLPQLSCDRRFRGGGGWTLKARKLYPPRVRSIRRPSPRCQRAVLDAPAACEGGERAPESTEHVARP